MRADQAEAMAPATALPAMAKTVIFIRHAESEWNVATKRPHRMVAALLRRDHPLSPKGYAQAVALQEALRDGKANGSGADLATTRSASTVWISPLSRALQTALIGLLPVLSREPMPPAVRVRPLIKEQRGSIVARDNVGAVTGSDLFGRACTRLLRFPMPPDSGALSAMREVGRRGDLSEVERPWWFPRRETGEALRARTHRMIDELRATEDSTLVVVSHSNFLKGLFAEHLSDDSCPTQPGLARALQTTKLPNCGVLVCTLEPSGARPLRSAHVVWPPEAAEAMIAMAARRGEPSRQKTAKVTPAPPA